MPKRIRDVNLEQLGSILDFAYDSFHFRLLCFLFWISFSMTPFFLDRFADQILL